MMTDEVKVSVRWEGKTAILDLIGDLTNFAEETVNHAYRTVSENGADNIILNFRENDYINSAGIAIVIGVVTEARKRNQHLALSGLSTHFQKIFRMVGLTQYADLYPTVGEALSALQGNTKG
ncbi:MAG: anti-sigma factor antagonist, partial [Chloroflexi bacterium]